jgi:hypothetical protein
MYLDRYFSCIADLPIAPGATIATYADDTAILMAYNNLIEASLRLYKKVSSTFRDG